jgi:hypothetical protein
MDVEPLSQLFSDPLADGPLAGENIGDSVLWRAVGQIFLLETMLIHQKAQHLLLSQVPKQIGKRMLLVLPNLIKQDIPNGKRLLAILLSLH